MKKVSIIMLTYDKLPYTKVSIESLYHFTPNDLFELICVNNGSVDGTREYLNTIPGCTVIDFEENVGGDKAFNEALKYASGEYTVFLNNDIILSKNWLEQLLYVMETDEKAGIVVPTCNSSSNFQAIQQQYTTLEEYYQFTEAYNHSQPNKWEERQRLMLYVALFRTEELKRIGGLDEVYSPGGFDDDDLGYRYRREGYKLILAKDTYIHHYGSVTIGGEYAGILQRNRKVFQGKFGVDSWEAANIDVEMIYAYDYTHKNPQKLLGVGESCGATLLQLKNQWRSLGYQELQLTYYALEPKYIIDLKTFCDQVYEGDIETIVEEDKEIYDLIVVEFDKDIEKVAVKLKQGGHLLLTTFKCNEGYIQQQTITYGLTIHTKKILQQRVFYVLAK